MQSSLPNFIVIGAPKSGTTSLYFYLRQHPEIYLPLEKELNYFSYPLAARYVNGVGDREALKRQCQSWEAYCRHYAEVGHQLAIGEISPGYLFHARDVAEAIAQRLGQVKIIAILRNPVDKAYSQYMHRVREGRESLDFYDALQAEEARRTQGWSTFWWDAQSSLYAERIKCYREVFGHQNVKVILFDNFVNDTPSTLSDLFEFIGVDSTFTCDTKRVYNRTGKPRSTVVANILGNPNPIKSLVKRFVPPQLRTSLALKLMDINTRRKESMNQRSRDYLADFFAQDIAQLEALLDCKTGW